AEIVEYATIRNTPIYTEFRLPSGQIAQYPPGRVVEIIEYPILGRSSVEDATESVHKLQSLLARYPEGKTRLTSALVKWQNALAFIQQSQKIAAKQTPKVTSQSVINGTTYESAVLTDVGADSVSITHAGGVDRISL